MARKSTKTDAPEGLTAQQRAFLKAFPEAFTIKAAAEAVGVERTRHYEWLKIEEYAAAFAEAQEAAADMLEELALAHVRQGTPGWNGTLTTLMKGARPVKYRDNVKHEHTGEVVQKVVILEGDAPKDP